MSRHYGKVEPSVMDEEMLQKAVEEQGPQEQAGRIAKEEGIHFSEVLQLRFAHGNILRIDHLWEFTSLTKLELNNNIIKKIEGLDRLTNLSWLNLSFNSIETIEGLESLVKLEDLNLSDNSISVIENMDTLENLTFFSIANNLVAQLDNVIYLRKFKNLHTLNLYGNPIREEDNYTFFIAAHLPDLVYLDYRQLDEQTKEQASDKYQHAIEEIRCNELQAQKALEASQSQEAELQLHRDAFVEALNGSYLFESMFTDDPEAETLSHLPGAADLLQTYPLLLVGLCVQLFEIGLVEHKLRETEVKWFLSGQEETVADNRQRGIQTVRIVESQQVSDTHQRKAKISQYGEEIKHLCDSLMTLEMQLANNLEDITQEFERNISDMIDSFTETAQDIYPLLPTFAQCRDLENRHQEALREIALTTLEKVANNELEDEITDDMRILFVDKDSVINALGASHDTNLEKINDRENQLVTRIEAWKVVLIKEIQDKQVKRNRKCVSEIHSYIDYLRKQLEELPQHE
ncbi:dynein regulatory complex subunit 3 [Diretmus argenteus]